MLTFSLLEEKACSYSYDSKSEDLSSVFILILLFLVDEFGLSLFNEGELNTVALRQGDSWALTITNDEDITDTGGEGVTVRVLDMSNIEGTWMLLDRLQDTNSTNVVSAGEINSGTVDVFNHTGDLFVSQVYLESIADANVWVRESEGSTIVCGHVWNLFLTNVLLDNLAELETSFLGIDSVWDESAFNIKQNSKELVRFFNCNNVHLAEWVSVVSSDLSIDLDEALLLSANLKALLSGKGVFQSLLK
jgi:hypothetical protein